MAINDWRTAFRLRMAAVGMTYAKIAVRLNMKPPSVYHFMEPASNPGIESLQKIADAIDCDLHIVFVKRFTGGTGAYNESVFCDCPARERGACSRCGKHVAEHHVPASPRGPSQPLPSAVVCADRDTGV